MTSNNSTIQNSPKNLAEVFGTSLHTKTEKNRSQTNKSKVQYRKLPHRQQVPTATSYNTTVINDRDQPMDPAIANSGNSGVFRRQANQARGSFRLPNRTHNKVNAPASMSLDKKHADLMSNNAPKIGSFKKSQFNNQNVQNQNT